MNFSTAIKTCVLKKFIDFSTRASRSEFWYFYLFYIIACFGGPLLIGALGGMTGCVDIADLGYLPCIIFFIPMVAVMVRRLHDLDKPNWMVALSVIPIINIYILILLCKVGTPHDNKYGPPL